MIIQIAHNAVIAKLIDASPDVKHIISELLSFQVNGAEFSQTFKSGSWDGRSSFFKYKTSSFPAGFVRMISNNLKRKGHKVKIINKPLPKPLGDIRPNINEFGYTDEYSYQPETVDRLIERGSMIAQIATGGGKSNICALAIARVKRPTLFITTRGVLLYQMKAALEDSIKYRAANGEPDLIGTEIGVIGDGEWNPKKITVAMVQTLASKLKDPDPFDSKNDQLRQARIRDKVKDLLSRYEMVILEEAHEASGNSYFSILSQCVNAHYRLALTATPFMKDDAEDNMRLMACVGSIGIKVTERELIDKGILAKPYFKYIDNPAPSKVKNGTSWQRAYKYGIVECEKRNGLIVQEALKMKQVNLSVITLIQHTNHGDKLKDMMQAAGLNVLFIRGSSTQQERQKALNKLGAGLIDVLIGSTICDVGIDVPSVGGIILAGGGKAEVALRQRIGRGLRRKKTGANVAFVVDFLDQHNSHTRGHAFTRRAIVEATDGFRENILSEGKDFPYDIL
jgi:superfamily II DNA or RNA helicase